jgi:hypothetical protein
MPQATSRKPSPAPIASSKLRLIHVARRQLQLTEDDYRSVLNLFGGVQHATELDQAGFTAVMQRMTDLGFASTSARRPLPARGGMASPAQSALIRQLWAECTSGEGTDATLGKWLERQFEVSSIRFLTTQTAHQAIGGLRAMKGKRKARTAASDSAPQAGA